MRIRIIGAAPGRWYADYVGACFDVDEYSRHTYVVRGAVIIGEARHYLHVDKNHTEVAQYQQEPAETIERVFGVDGAVDSIGRAEPGT